MSQFPSPPCRQGVVYPSFQALRLPMNTKAFCLISYAVLVLAIAGCGGGGGGGASVPVILNLNNATTPASPVDLAIEVNGSGFQSAPGEVHFAEGSNIAVVIPPVGGWESSNVLAVVPSFGSNGPFTVPGTVTVTVVTSGGTSNGVDLDLVSTPTFNNGDVQWNTTTALPTPLRGHCAVGIEDTSTTGWTVVTGGNDGVQNVAAVHVSSLAEDGQLGSWTSAMSLPLPRAHHAMVLAHPGNSPVMADDDVIYVIGGQEAMTDAPGGTDTVYAAHFTPSTGVMGNWTQVATLPEPIQGSAAVIYNGFLYVVGGLRQDGTPGSSVRSARVNADGTLAAWQTFVYPVAISFTQVFGFGGNLSVLCGDDQPSTDPNAQGQEGIDQVWYARARNGQVGTWVSTTQPGKRRKKHVAWVAFGQVLLAEGIYQGSPGSQELERNVIQPDSQLSSWNNITSSSNQAGANVYNAAHFVSPIRPPNGGPRFLLLGGQAFSPSPPGALSSTVYYNTAP